MTAHSHRLPWRGTPRARPWLLLWLAVFLPITGLAARAAAPAATAAAPACRPPAAHRDAIPRGFLGYACRDARCGSHKAGFDWAERNSIADPRACQARNDASFAEGCRAYAEDTVTAEQAGFQWARDNDLADPCLCAGAGPGFEAGCQAYVHGFAD